MDTDTDTSSMERQRLRTLSLFSGISGIELGLRRWCRTVCYVELDSYAQATLCENMAAGNLDVAPIWDDVTTFGESELESIGPIECITGGFPCQDISCAGKGAGIHGERSGLFFEIIRIVRLARPRIVFLENVPALLARGMDTVLGELSESGNDAKWRVLSAAEVGANHKRDRIWIVGVPGGYEQGRLSVERGQTEKRITTGRPGEVLADAERNRRKQSTEIFCGGKPVSALGGENVADADSQGLSQRPRKENRRRAIRKERETVTESGWWTVEPDVGRVAHGVPFRVDRLKCLGNAVVPQCAEKAFELLAD